MPELTPSPGGRLVAAAAVALTAAQANAVQQQAATAARERDQQRAFFADCVARLEEFFTSCGVDLPAAPERAPLRRHPLYDWQGVMIPLTADVALGYSPCAGREANTPFHLLRPCPGCAGWQIAANRFDYGQLAALGAALAAPVWTTRGHAGCVPAADRATAA